MPAGADRPGWRAGWWRDALAVPSPNHGARPRDAVIDLLVLHSISLPPGVYGGDEIERLFTNRLDPAAHPYFESLRGLRVSAHFLIRRGGELLQFVGCDRRAWHAGTSSWRGRSDCNDHSIGVELEGLEGDEFDAAQYRTLTRLVRALRRRYAIEEIVGHEQIAPGRKHDPGPGFDAHRLARSLRRLSDCRRIQVTIGKPVTTPRVTGFRLRSRASRCVRTPTSRPR